MQTIINYYNQWSVLLFSISFLFCVLWVRPRFGLIPALFLIFLTASSLWVWMWEHNRYVTVNPYDQMALRYFAADSLLKTVLLLVPAMVFSKEREDFYLIGALASLGFCLINSVAIFIQFLSYGCKTSNSCGGILGNPSISVSLMVCMLPLFVEKKIDLVIVAIIGAAVLLSKSSIGIGLLFLFGVLFFFRKLSLRIISASLLSGLGFLAAAYLVYGNEFFNDSDRFVVWKFMMERWMHPGNLFFGTGFGTYHVFSINLQHYGGIAPGSHWSFLHNDWMQILFETGIIGLVLGLMTYILSIKRAWEEKPVLFSIILFGAYMFLNPALHLPYPILFGTWIFTYALRRPLQKVPLTT